MDARLPDVAAALRSGGNLVIQAEPGAGKTTRVPPALVPLLAGTAHPQVVVLEPRRLAARMAAARVAEEEGTRLGDRVGYQVRFEDVTGPNTSVRFVTEGILVRQLLSSPQLRGVGAVILDEFHERHIHTDVSLALLRRLQQTHRPDLRILVMSATLEAAPVARFLGDAPVLQVEGRVFPVEVEHAHTTEPVQGGRPLERLVAEGVGNALRGSPSGHVLVFLPGAAEIRRSMEACAELCARFEARALPLHADLTPEEQNAAVNPSRQRKVIFSTNVAESSVTVDGVVAVVDSGLARIPQYAAWSGVPVLKVARVSRASAIQRAGRAGRTGPGRCIRLYTRHDLDTRAEHTVPELRRLDLAESVLLLHGLGVEDATAFPFFEAPEPSAITGAQNLLRLLGALSTDGRLTEVGRAMLTVPLHPRQSRVLMEACRAGLPEEGALVAGILGEGGILERRPMGGAGRAQSARHTCDVMMMLDMLMSARAAGNLVRQASSLGLDGHAAQRVDRTARSLMGAARQMARGSVPPAPKDQEAALQKAILAGYPDRVAMRRQKGGAARGSDVEIVLASGGTATLDGASNAAQEELLMALDAQERSTGGKGQVRVSVASGIQVEWLLDVVPDLLSDVTEAEWNPQAQRAEAYSRMKLMGLTLQENRLGGADHPAVAAVLRKHALAAGARAFCDPEDLEHLKARVALLRQHFPQKEIPELDDALVARAMGTLCEGRQSLAELKEAGLLGALMNALGEEAAALLQRDMPDSIRLPNTRRVTVHYVAGQPPWVESRLQDFFGQMQTPRILQGKLPLNVHLLAPNQRAVQITNDLAGFWERHYPAIRRELMRKYPRHSWPEDPRTAQPPEPGKRR
jgi:ATP-dependent helicase HrpB